MTTTGEEKIMNEIDKPMTQDPTPAAMEAANEQTGNLSSAKGTQKYASVSAMLLDALADRGHKYDDDTPIKLIDRSANEEELMERAKKKLMHFVERINVEIGTEDELTIIKPCEIAEGK